MRLNHHTLLIGVTISIIFIVFFNINIHSSASPLEVSFKLSTTSWEPGTIENGSSETMGPSQLCVIKNTGTEELDLGLTTISEFWIPNYPASENEFILLAKFNESFTAPGLFDYNDDIVLSYRRWADTEIYGPLGYDLAPGDSINLWLQLTVPFVSVICDLDTWVELVIYGYDGREMPSHTHYTCFYYYCDWDSGGPPDSIEVREVDCNEDSTSITLMASSNPLGAEWFNVYRDIHPIIWIISINDSLRVGTTDTRYFTDDFSDSSWLAYESKGLCDCGVNYFYAITTGDTMATGDTAESAYPSNCVGEFDFCLQSPVGLTHQNNIVYTLRRSEIMNAASPNADDLLATINGSATLKRWNAEGQVWEVIAFWSDFPEASYVGINDVELLNPYVVDGDLLDPVWSMQVPGNVPHDPHFNLVHNDFLTSWNHISLPFYEQQIAEIETGCDLYADIYECETIMEWDASGQVWIVVAFWSGFLGTCVGSGPVRAGYPYMVSVSASSTWPPGW